MCSLPHYDTDASTHAAARREAGPDFRVWNVYHAMTGTLQLQCPRQTYRNKLVLTEL